MGMVAEIWSPFTITGTVVAGATADDITELPALETTAAAVPGATVCICITEGKTVGMGVRLNG